MSDNKTNYPKEEVLCVSKNAWKMYVEKASSSQMIINRIVNNGVMLRRDYAETDADMLQVIPYIVLRSQDSVMGDDLIYCFRRRGNEKGLNDLMSIGVGGHLNSNDYKAEAERELKEEAGLGNKEWEVLGFIRTNDKVGRYHVGILHILDIERKDLRRKQEIRDGSWIPVYILCKFRGYPDWKLESWALHVIEKGYLERKEPLKH